MYARWIGSSHAFLRAEALALAAPLTPQLGIGVLAYSPLDRGLLTVGLLIIITATVLIIKSQAFKPADAYLVLILLVLGLLVLWLVTILVLVLLVLVLLVLLSLVLILALVLVLLVLHAYKAHQSLIGLVTLEPRHHATGGRLVHVTPVAMRLQGHASHSLISQRWDSKPKGESL